MKDRKKKRQARTNGHAMHIWHTLRWRLTLFVFGIMLLSGILTMLVHILVRAVFAGAPLLAFLTLNPYFFLMIMLGVCTVIGTILAGNFGFYYLDPLRRLSAATKEVKKGNFKVQVKTESDPESEIGQLVVNFNEMVRELDGVELFRNDFINNFSHEFKTPIVSIRGFARELQQDDLSAEQRHEYATIIAEEADRLARLSTNVLELSKLENQRIVTGQSDFYLDEQLRQCILLLEPQWSEKQIEMIPELEEIKVFSNAEMLSQIWKNLLSNAIKFTPAGGTISVSLTATDNQACVTVKDTGIGMTDEVKKRIFEKFYQGDSAHHHAGYGIGLTMVDRVVKLCGGTIAVESEVGVGSSFTVTLPRQTVIEAEIVE